METGLRLKKQVRLAVCDWKALRYAIVAALRKYDSKRSAGALPTGRKFFIWYKGRTYPPKEIRSIVEARPVTKFSGGGKTNQMFRDLGFTVVKGLQLVPLYKSYKENQSGRDLSLRQLDDHLAELFRQPWAELKKELADGRISSCPGVYLLAYSSERVAHKRVRVEDVFYVGMTTTALSVRLRQFWEGIHNRDVHTGGMRFCRVWAGSQPFDEVETDNKFYVATLPIQCEPKKDLRTPADLEKLGMVAALEYLALARVKRELDLEPPLNKK
jgi:hypothetical protein